VQPLNLIFANIKLQPDLAQITKFNDHRIFPDIRYVEIMVAGTEAIRITRVKSTIIKKLGRPADTFKPYPISFSLWIMLVPVIP
jgi:hypothetical protein